MNIHKYHLPGRMIFVKIILSPFPENQFQKTAILLNIRKKTVPTLFQALHRTPFRRKRTPQGALPRGVLDGTVLFVVFC